MASKRPGRPTVFNKKIQGQIKVLALQGLTDALISAGIGVTEQTLNNWKNKHPDFFESLKNWKDHADADVEKSLYKRATGYVCKETKVQLVTDETGSRWEQIELEKHYPPDTVAAIFWLKNRQPKRWKDTKEVQFDATTHLMGAVVAALKEGKGKE